mgnify:CR=1 FL=1
MSAGRALLPLAALTLAVACSPDTPENEVAANDALQSAEQAALGETGGGGADAEGSSPALDDENLPTDFARTAWRVEDADGARYTTYLDDGGLYRDFRNGDLWHSGRWEVDGEGRLCLTPEADETSDETAPITCWSPRGMDGDSGMIVQASSGKRVRLQQVEYRAPEDGAAEATAPA